MKKTILIIMILLSGTLFGNSVLTSKNKRVIKYGETGNLYIIQRPDYSLKSLDKDTIFYMSQKALCENTELRVHLEKGSQPFIYVYIVNDGALTLTISTCEGIKEGIKE